MEARIRGEYWLLPDGQLLQATDGGDHNHEGWVYEYILQATIDAVRSTEWGAEIIPEDWVEQYGYDYIMFRDYLANELDAAGIDLDTADDEIDQILVDQYGADQQKWFYPIFSNQADAREFAINYWGWTRIAFNNAELPSLSPAALRHAGKGFAEILDEEYGDVDYDTELTVSTFRGNAVTTTLNNLLDGRLEGEDPHAEQLRLAGKREVDKLNQQAQHPFYRGKYESVENLIVSIEEALFKWGKDPAPEPRPVQRQTLDAGAIKRMENAFRLNGFDATLDGDYFTVSHKELGTDRYGRQAMISKTDRVPANEWDVRQWLGLPV